MATMQDLEYDLDMAERAAHELREELSEHEEDSAPWQLCLEELNDAENEVEYFRTRLETGDYMDE